MSPLVVRSAKNKTLDEAPQKPEDAAYRRIEKAAGVNSPNDELRRGLDRLIEDWSKFFLHATPNVRSRVFFKTVQRLKADAERLLRDLTGGPPDKNPRSERAWAYEEAAMAVFAGDELVEQLQRLIDDAEVALDIASPGKTGRRADLAFHKLLDQLTGLYEQVAGHQARASLQGPFLRFVKACIEQLRLEDDPREDEALAKAIQRHLARRSKS